jgi:hypothetical protein
MAAHADVVGHKTREARSPPNEIDVAPGRVEKFDPEIATAVPPATGPEPGLTEVTTGALGDVAFVYRAPPPESDPEAAHIAVPGHAMSLRVVLVGNASS